MNKTYKIAGVVLLVLLLVGGYFYPTRSVKVGAISAVGTTNSTRRIATVVMTPSTAAASTTSILNTDSQDRGITDSYAFCSGLATSNAFLSPFAGIRSLIVNMATTTTNGIGLQGNTNYASSLDISTTTLTSYQSTTTETFPIGIGRIWPSGTYLSITFNATNTASCVVGVSYLSL